MGVVRGLHVRWRLSTVSVVQLSSRPLSAQIPATEHICLPLDSPAAPALGQCRHRRFLGTAQRGAPPPLGPPGQLQRWYMGASELGWNEVCRSVAQGKPNGQAPQKC